MATGFSSRLLEWRLNAGVRFSAIIGKTTMTEAMLYITREIPLLGSVKDGTTTMDFLEQEKKRAISIRAAIGTCHWKGHQLNIIDTPGHIDFIEEVHRTFAVLDGAIIVVDGCKGVQAQTLALWRYLNYWNLPRLVFVNKMDRLAASLRTVVDHIRLKLAGTSCRPIIVSLPIPNGLEEWRPTASSDVSAVTYILDLISLKATCHENARKTGFLPATQRTVSLEELKISDKGLREVKILRSALLEHIAECDEAFQAHYISAQDEASVDAGALREALARLILKQQVLPIYAGAALHTWGIQQVLDGVISLIPSPIGITLAPVASISRPIVLKASRKALHSYSKHTNTSTAKNQTLRSPASCLGLLRKKVAANLTLCSSEAHMNNGTYSTLGIPYSDILPSAVLCRTDVTASALVFKVLPDRLGKRLAFVRVYSGVLVPKMCIFNSITGTLSTVHSIFRVKADRYTMLSELTAGDVGVIRGPSDVSAGDTLHETSGEKVPFRFFCGSTASRDPVCSASIEPETEKDETRVTEALQGLCIEDSSLHLVTDPQTQQRQLWGRGALHLQVACERLLSDYGVRAYLGRLEIAYLEHPDVPLTASCASNESSELADESVFRVTLTPRPLSVALGIHDPPMDITGHLENKLFIECPSSIVRSLQKNDLLPQPQDDGSTSFDSTPSSEQLSVHRVHIADGKPIAHAALIATGVSEDLLHIIHDTMTAALSSGPLSGYPVAGVDVKVTILEFLPRERLASTARTALSRLFRKALRGESGANPPEFQLLEPIVRVQAEANDSRQQHALISSLTDRESLGGTLLGVEMASDHPLERNSPEKTVVYALVPLVHADSLSTLYRKITRGEGDLRVESWGYSFCSNATAAVFART